MTPTEQDIRSAIAQQAADWFVGNQSEPLAEQERVAFMSWLRASPIHVEEYLRMAAISRDLGVAAADPQLTLEGLLAEVRQEREQHATGASDIRARPGRTLGSLGLPGWLIGGLATAAAALVGIVVLRMAALDSSGPGQRYVTARGEQRSWGLPDGSTLQLNTDSVVWVRFNRGERVLELAQGQAYFSVAHEAQRRFRVIAGGADVVAVGTQFDIYRHEQTAVVTVAEGRVAVYGGRAPTPVGASLAASGTGVAAGERLSVVASHIIAAPTSVNLEQSESWRTGRVVFEQQSLGQVVAEFNRYALLPIEVSDPQLRELVISGAFDARDIDSFIAFLQATDAVQVTRNAQRILIERR